MFKVVATLSLEKCTPKPDVKYLNVQGYVRQAALHEGGSTDAFDVEISKGFDRRMTVAFRKPFVAEILGGGFEKVQNETFEMLRHPRVKKLHNDRTWEDCVTLDDLERMAAEKWEVPDADKLDGHAKDVALLAHKYRKEMGDSQATVTTDNTTQQTTLRTTQETILTITPLTPRVKLFEPTDVTVQETQQHTYSTVSSTQCSTVGSTQGKGIRASCSLHVLVRKDTSERLAHMTVPPQIQQTESMLPTSVSTAEVPTKKRSFTELISPPNAKRRKLLIPLQSSGGNRTIGKFAIDSQEDIVHLYINEGVQVQIHAGPVEEKT
jgi:DNA ligase-4